MTGVLLVVIDAQRGFVDPEGSLARAFGIDEIVHSATALTRLRAHVSRRDRGFTTVFVRSEYRPAQFTAGRLDHPLAHICVPGYNLDCEWAPGLDVSGAHAVITKYDVDAATAPVYRDLIAQAVSDGIRHVVLAGFQFTTCVRASALTTQDILADSGVQVSVAAHLTGARASSYHAKEGGVSRVEATRRELVARGVTLLHTLIDAA
jgi:nicotinamidase-related amidase